MSLIFKSKYLLKILCYENKESSLGEKISPKWFLDEVILQGALALNK